MQQLSAMRSSLSSCGNLLAPQAHHRAQMGAAGAHGRVEEGVAHQCSLRRRASRSRAAAREYDRSMCPQEQEERERGDSGAAAAALRHQRQQRQRQCNS